MSSLVVLLPIAIAVPLSLVAQDSTKFRRGQWAAQFQVGSSSASLGFLKFRSPTRALVLDVRLTGAHSEQSVTDSGGTRFAGLASDAFTQIRFGWRRYRAGATKLVSHHTIGLLAGLNHDVSRSTVSLRESNAWTAGVFADIGGTYLVTPQLGLGALATASLTYSRSVTKQQPTNFIGRTWQIGGSGVSGTLVATLFF